MINFIISWLFFRSKLGGNFFSKILVVNWSEIDKTGSNRFIQFKPASSAWGLEQCWGGSRWPWWRPRPWSLHQSRSRSSPSPCRFQKRPEIEISRIVFFLKNGASLASYIVYFWSFQTNITIFLQQYNVKNFPSSIRCRDSNPQPLGRESPPITTRPGLPRIVCTTISKLNYWPNLVTLHQTLTVLGNMMIRPSRLQ